MEHEPQTSRSPERTKRSAYDDAVRRLGRRPHAAEELRRWLLDRGHDTESVERAVERCAERRWLDDASLARDYIVARAARIGHGPRRLIAELVGRGVEESVADSAWRAALDEGSVDLDAMLARRVRRRLAGRGPLTPAASARMYTALLREGFERDEIRRALRPHAAAPTPDGRDDDFA